MSEIISVGSTVMGALGQVLSVLVAVLGLAAATSHPLAPCGSMTAVPADTVRGHLRAVANHLRAIAVLLRRKVRGS
ncbi:hypothetical protein OG689_41530 [Kitasatospora sp. NBC_00240]|uniref:hypothetical protein n=1 Tax=Kitasatospora sp. NBC_00240 TaxID=2903567 RepID=UPI00224E0E7E|nr:hypothetical protein [Kitasatospora sp. NBC_00240]MCX5215639.1 hypothetical protein [Kitasatospora sp. NBC_00240]